MSRISTANHIQVVVVGAGVIGLAVARALARVGREVLLVDRASTIGSETSSRNSEVIHAGIYYPENSLKAQLCVKGNDWLYQYCESRNLSYRQCGKLVVATHSKHWEEDLPKLKQRALRNGVDGMRLLSSEDVSYLEPEIHCVGALWSPSSGVLDSHSLMLSLLADAEEHGATLALRSTVTGGNIILSASTQPHSLVVDGMDLSCDVVVNCAGLSAHKVAAALHHGKDQATATDIPDAHSSRTNRWQPPAQYFAKGTYFRLQGRANPFHHLVYPIPEEGGLGVHITTDWSGLTVKFGPDVEWIAETISDPDVIDLNPNPARLMAFCQAIRKYWPQLTDDTLVPDYAGIRPKLYHPQFLTATGHKPDHFCDFLIVGPRVHGIPGIVHLFGIESPGLTSCLAIADYVSSIVQDEY